MAKPRLLVVDIDGTLLNRSGAISPADRRALAAASRAGIVVSLSTGRAIEATRPILHQLSLDGYHMFFDGALVADPESGDEAYVEPLDHDLLREVTEHARRRGVALELYSADGYFVEQEDWATDIRREFFRIEPTVTDFDRVWREERIIKGTIPARSASAKAAAVDFCRHFERRLHFSWTRTPAYPDVDFVNVIAAEASKGRALEELAAFMGITPGQVAAIGNGENDVSLLRSAGLAIAMGDATDGLKALADFVAPDVEHSGVAVAVERFIL